MFCGQTSTQPLQAMQVEVSKTVLMLQRRQRDGLAVRLAGGKVLFDDVERSGTLGRVQHAAESLRGSAFPAFGHGVDGRGPVAAHGDVGARTPEKIVHGPGRNLGRCDGVDKQAWPMGDIAAGKNIRRGGLIGLAD